MICSSCKKEIIELWDEFETEGYYKSNRKLLGAIAKWKEEIEDEKNEPVKLPGRWSMPKND
jgi:hypothetical protein